MTGLAHLVASSAVYRVGRRRLSFPLLFGLGFASHFLLDGIPHHDLGIRANILLLAAGGLFILYLMYRDRHPLLLFAALAGVLPDALVLGRVSPFFTHIHDCCHFHGLPVSPAWLLPEAALIACSFWILWLPEK